MRIGQNPAKFVKDVAKPERITAAVLNYIPFLSGFYADMLDVLKANLTSLRETADMPLDVLVFDNASCDEVRQFLLDEHQAGRIQYLYLSSRNLGRAVPGMQCWQARRAKLLRIPTMTACFTLAGYRALWRCLKPFPM